MSYVRFAWLRRWTDGRSGVYAYLERQPDSDKDMVRISSYGDVVLYPEDFLELVMSVLEQAGVADKLTREDILRIAERCGVPAQKVRIIDRDEYIEKAVEDMLEASKEISKWLKGEDGGSGVG